MDPALLRGNLALALFILLLALMILPFQDRSSGAFVVTVLAVVVALLFIAAIWLLTRYFSPRLPPKEDDKQAVTLYNVGSPGQTAGRVEPPEGEG